jgi:hypothetical protein
MKKWWDSDPFNRPTIIMLKNFISEWIRYIDEYYIVNRNENYKFEVSKVDNQLKDDILEFVKANEALAQKQANTSIIKSHSQAHYKSCKFTEILV